MNDPFTPTRDPQGSGARDLPRAGRDWSDPNAPLRQRAVPPCPRDAVPFALRAEDRMRTGEPARQDRPRGMSAFPAAGAARSGGAADEAPMHLGHSDDAGPGPRPPAGRETAPPQAGPEPGSEAGSGTGPPDLPADFVFDTEHPVLPVPFTARIGGQTYRGTGLSVTAAYIATEGAAAPAQGARDIAVLTFDYGGFALSISPEIVLARPRRSGEATLQFLDPAGAHLPQLRYVLNSFIAGDSVAMGSLIRYTGPTRPKETATAPRDTTRMRLRSFAVAVASLTLIVATVNILINRATQNYEPRPVFIERAGSVMKATSAGQISFLNPAAKAGDVVFSLNANSGDVLNFQLPCDCTVTVAEGIFEGATVLPVDPVLTFFDDRFGIRVQTQMTIDGVARVMGGDQAYLDLSDGRKVKMRVVVTAASSAAASRGEDIVPVRLVPLDRAELGLADIGKAARLRLYRPLFAGTFLNPLEES